MAKILNRLTNGLHDTGKECRVGMQMWAQAWGTESDDMAIGHLVVHGARMGRRVEPTWYMQGCMR